MQTHFEIDSFGCHLNIFHCHSNHALFLSYSQKYLCGLSIWRCVTIHQLFCIHDILQTTASTVHSYARWLVGWFDSAEASPRAYLKPSEIMWQLCGRMHSKNNWNNERKLKREKLVREKQKKIYENQSPNENTNLKLFIVSEQTKTS